MAVRQVAPVEGLKADWIVMAIPLTLAIRLVNPNASLLITGILVVLTFIRKTDARFNVQAGPLLLFFGACGIVLSRPDFYYALTAFLLIGILILRLIATVDARKIIASLMDGFGLLIVANLLAETLNFGIVSTDESARNLQESTGFVRAVFPLSAGINALSIVAAVYLVTSVFFLREAGWSRRTFRLICACAALLVIIKAGSRNALADALVFSAAALLIPSMSRWIAQATTLVGAVSAFVLPGMMKSFGFIVAPLIGLNPGRDTTESNVMSLQGRQQLWEIAINYWNDKITEIPDKVLGFGEVGQYHSGVSLMYTSITRGLSPQLEYINVHNSFLQQLFDGGVLGWLLFAAAIYWASARFAAQRREWGHYALAAIFALATLLVGNTTEATMAPGVHLESFWMLFVLVGTACQATRIASPSSALSTSAIATNSGSGSVPPS